MPALIERRKMTRATYQALKRHILREREKRKLEQEADLALEQQRKEVERRKRLENENKNSLQKIKDELIRLEKQLEDHRKEKSKLFGQLKRILESENTKKANEKKHETQLYPSGGQPGAPNHSMHFLSGTGHMGRPVMFKPALHPGLSQPSTSGHNAPPPPNNPVKRRSPSPVSNSGVANVFQFHPGNQPTSMYGGGKYVPPAQEAYSPYSHHQSKGNKPALGKPQHLQPPAPVQTSSSDGYTNRHSIGQVLPHNLPESARGPQMPPQRHPAKGSIVTGVTSYQMHPNSQTHPGSRVPRPLLPGSHNIPPVRNQYQRENRPYY